MSFMSFTMQVNSMLFSLLFCQFPSSLPLLFHFQNCSNVSAKNLQQQLDILEGDSLNWRAQAEDHERALTHSLEFCTARGEMSEVRTHVHTHTRAHAHIHTCTRACTYTHTRTHTHTYTCVHAHAHIHAHIHTRTHAHIRTHTHSESGDFLFTLDL